MTTILCRHCGEPIQQRDIGMRGPSGPWIHEFPRVRLCYKFVETHDLPPGGKYPMAEPAEPDHSTSE